MFLLISEAGLQTVREADLAQNNCLLEYEYALQKLAQNTLQICPLLLRSTGVPLVPSRSFANACFAHSLMCCVVNCAANGRNRSARASSMFDPRSYPDTAHKSETGHNIRETMRQLFKLKPLRAVCLRHRSLACCVRADLLLSGSYDVQAWIVFGSRVVSA